MKIFTSYLFAAAAFLTSTAFAGDDHPHRTITISGECRGCELAHENLYGAEILGALFVEANFDDANLNQSVIVESRFIDSVFNRTDFSRSRLSGVLFQGSTLEGAIFSGAHGERVRFDSTDLSSADLTQAMMILANFTASNLSDADFTAARLFNTRFDGATLDRTDFTATRMPSAIFRNSMGRDIIFVGADLRGADFSGAELVEANFEGAILHGARFEGTILIDARGLSAEALSGACRDAESQLPEALELMECSDRPAAANNQGNIRTTIQFSVRQGSINQPNGAVSHRVDNDIRLELIRNEQLRAVREFEIARETLEISRQEIAEAIAQAEAADMDIQESMLAETEEQIRAAQELEEQLEQQRDALENAMRDNPEILRVVRGSAERLMFLDDTREPVADPERMRAIVVDGNRYQLNGRYRWMLDRPNPPMPPSPVIIDEETLGPKAPDDELTLSEND